MDVTFSDWLVGEMQAREMTQADLARKSGVSTGGISDLLTGRREPGVTIASKIAKGLDIPEEQVFRAAGILPNKPADEEELEQIMYEVRKMNKNDRPFNRHRLLDLLQTIGARAAITDLTVHRFRHTCAIEYLRNGGDPYTLQRLLGHSTLDMVKRYLAIVQTDIEKAHRRASPVDNWAL